jgi:hypothetical protein
MGYGYRLAGFFFFFIAMFSFVGIGTLKAE